MAILIDNTMRFLSDVGLAANPNPTPEPDPQPSDKNALLVAKQAFDTANYTSVEGFNITGTEPSKTTRRFLFKVDNKLYKFSGTNVVEYTGAGQVDDILTGGNTAAEVTAVKSIPAWIGKKIYPVIALHADGDATSMPTAAVSLNVRSDTTVLTKTITTNEYPLTSDSDTPTITNLTANTSLKGKASINVATSLKNPSGSWTSYISLEQAKGQQASAIKFQITFTVTTTDGSDSAGITTIIVNYSSGSSKVGSDTVNLYSIAQDYEHDLQTCYVTVKHQLLSDSTVKAFVNFSAPPKTRNYLTLQSSGSKTFILGENSTPDPNINPNSIKLFNASNNPISSFTFDTASSQVVITTADEVIYASYEYDLDEENWREMTVEQNQQPYNNKGLYLTRFSCVLLDAHAKDMQISNVRIQLTRPNSHTDDEILGTATGKTDKFILQHQATKVTACDATSWNYDAALNMITCQATQGTQITASYDWTGDEITLEDFAAGWAVKM